MPGGAYTLLFELVVVHEYHADPARCRLDFLPDRAAAAWLRQARCILRPLGNRLRVMTESAADDVTRTGPATLNFAVRAVDPGFGRYTAGVRAPAAGAGMVPLVFDTADALPVGSDGSFALDDACLAVPATVSATSSLGGGFVVAVPLTGSGDVGRTHRVDLASRSMPWTYVLGGDWSMDDPIVVDPAADDPEDAFEALTVPAGAGPIFRSRLPLPLAERPRNRIELWSRRGGKRDRLLIRTLPTPDVANLARSDPADKASLVCEIFVSR